MKFSKYRNLALRALWPKIESELMIEQRVVCCLPEFSAWHIDDICANAWHESKLINDCVNTLFAYINFLVGEYE